MFAATLAAQAPPSRIQVALEARSIQPGELVVLTMTTTEPVDALEVQAFDRAWPAYRTAPESWRALVGIDLDVKPGRYTAAIRPRPPQGGAALAHPLVVEPKAFPTRRLTVDEAFVNPPASVTKRIEEEAARLGRLWRSSSATRLWSDAFIRPVPQPANSRFGSRSILNGQPRSPHGGADFASPAGTPVRAPNDGQVLLAGDLYYTGGTVMVDHGMGLISLFAHLSRVDVAEGERVERGAVVGAVGATGRVTGPHLHWTLRANGARVDPLSLIAVLGDQ
jgi:murein DD-endopeptidase MepM/ murein hydrolase activator NlpD